MPELSVGVRDLLALKYGPRHLSRSSIHPVMLQQGIQGHKSVAENRPPEYLREVPVESSWQEDDWRLRVRGRIDGLLTREDYILVEEIKTTSVDPQMLPVEHQEFYLAQLILYTYFVALDNPHRQIVGRLCWLHLDTNVESFVDLSPEQLAWGEELFRQLATEYIRREKSRREAQTRRNQSLAQITFPYPDYRPGQEELIGAAAGALAQDKDLLAQAATGIGKTSALLLPAITWLRSAPPQAKVFFLTAKTTGRDIALETLTRWQELELVSVCLEAKERWCNQPAGDCDNCPLAKDFYPKAAKIMANLLASRLVTPPLIQQWAEAEGICPFELGLEASTQADLVIADYNYVFDPMVQLQRFFGRKRIPAVLLIDEAHNLVPRGREMFSADLNKREILQLSRELKLAEPLLATKLRQLNSIFGQWTKELKAEGAKRLLIDQLPPSLISDLNHLGEKLALTAYTSPNLVDFSRRLARFNRILPLLGPNHAVYMESQGGNTTLNLYCINPGPLLQKQRGKATAIFFSATLSPTSYYRQLLGCREDPLHLELASPFPRENRLYVHVPGIMTTYTARTRYYKIIADNISTVIRFQLGNYIAYFPSYSFLEEVGSFLQSQLPPDYLFHSQRPGMSIASRQKLLQNFGASGANICLAVMGGLFGEGIDLPGEKLIGTIIVGPGLPTVSPQQELIRDYFQRQEGEGFLYAYLIPGMQRVIQSAGRVFRSPEDRGVVVLLDDRFRQNGYRQLLPAEWEAEGLFANDWQSRISDFWQK